MKLVFDRRSLYLSLTVLSSCVFLLYLFWNAYVSLGYEGGWDLYAQGILDGADIHADMGYLLPALYPKFISYIYANFKDMAGNMIKIIHIALYVSIPWMFFLVLRRFCNNYDKWIIGSLSITLTLFMIQFKALRVVDYHIISILGVLLVAILVEKKASLLFAVVIISIVTCNRPHDGIALAMATFFATCLLHGRTMGAAFLFGFIFSCIGFLYIVDPDYFASSILLSAGQAKGLSFTMVPMLPLIALGKTLQFILTSPGFIVSVSLIVLINEIEKYKLIQSKNLISICVLWILYFSWQSLDISLLLVYIAASCALVRLRNDKGFVALSLVLVSYTFSSLISSKGNPLGMYVQGSLVACLGVIYYLKTNIRTKFDTSAKYWDYVYSIVTLLLIFKIFLLPFGWHLYNSPNLGSGISKTDKGYASQSALKVATDLCPKIKNRIVLSIPYSYYVYECDAKPWMNIVASFYDTSSADFIDRLMLNMEKDPPEFVIYTRQLEILDLHKKAYKSSVIDSQFKMDEYLMDQIKLGVLKIRGMYKMNGEKVKSKYYENYLSDKEFERPPASIILMELNKP